MSYVTLATHLLITRESIGFQLPTFQIFRHGKKVDELVGSDPNKLEVPFSIVG